MNFTRRFRLPRRRAAGDDLDFVGSGSSSSSCPRCARPLSAREFRCPGCGSYVVGGTLLRSAVVLVVVGVVVGGIGFAALSGILGSSPAQLPASAGSPAATGAAALTPGPPAVVAPSAVRAGIVQASAVNERLMRSASALQTAVRSKTGAADIATVLRKISADTTYGGQVVTRLQTWTGTAALGDRLDALYGSLGTVADAGLTHALSDQAGYRAAGNAMLKSLRGLAAAAKATTDAATAYGVGLPGSSAAP